MSLSIGAILNVGYRTNSQLSQSFVNGLTWHKGFQNQNLQMERVKATIHCEPRSGIPEQESILSLHSQVWLHMPQWQQC